MPRHEFTRAERQRGGRITAAKAAPGPCPKCGKTFPSHLAYAGHLGLHGLADRYCQGDLKQAVVKFNLLGIAATDSHPGNGAFARAHQVQAEIQNNPEVRR
jgi:hypothetical protein